MGSGARSADASPATEVVVVVGVNSQLVVSVEIAVLMAAARRAKLRGLCIEGPGLRQVVGRHGIFDRSNVCE